MELKWTIHELIKRAKNDNFIDEIIDLRPYLNPEIDDLVDISKTSVEGNYLYYPDEELFEFDLRVKTKLTMLCSISLDLVEINLDFDTQLNFSLDFIDDNTHVIEGITLDLKPYIFSEILVEKPMRVIAKGAYDNFHEDVVEISEKELQETNPFAKLKK